MWRFWLLLTDVPEEKIEVLKRRCIDGEAHPMKVKKELAKRITRDFHGEEAAEQAAANWEKQFQRDEMPEDLETVEVKASEIAVQGSKDFEAQSKYYPLHQYQTSRPDTQMKAIRLDKLLALCKLADSISDAGRKIKAKSVKVSGKVVEMNIVTVYVPDEVVIRVGRNMKRLRLKG
jgi:tyrosyl-tRNA synthetase